MAATTTCPFECGWDSGEATTEEGGRAALRAHLTVEHEARPERNERAWADEMADMQAELAWTPVELIEAGYDPVEAQKLDALQARARRFGGRVRVQRRGVALGRQRYTFVVDLDPQVHRPQSSEEPQHAHGNFADAEQHVIALEKRYGAV